MRSLNSRDVTENTSIAQEEARRITGKYIVTSTGTPIRFGEVITAAAISEMQDADAVLDKAYKAYMEAKRRFVESQQEV